MGERRRANPWAWQRQAIDRPAAQPSELHDRYLKKHMLVYCKGETSWPYICVPSVWKEKSLSPSLINAFLVRCQIGTLTRPAKPMCKIHQFICNHEIFSSAAHFPPARQTEAHSRLTDDSQQVTTLLAAAAAAMCTAFSMHLFRFGCSSFLLCRSIHMMAGWLGIPRHADFGIP